MPDYVSLSNYYGSVKPPTKAQEKLIKELEDMNLEARNHNSRKQNEKVIKGPLKRFCSLCNSELVVTKKVEHIEELNIDIPRYKCKTCGQIFSGIGLELWTPNHKAKAICFEMDGTL